MRSKRVINPADSETREAIAKAAARRFAMNGIQQTTMREITEDAGISLGAVNYHFGSKDGLAYEVFDALTFANCEARHRAYDALEAGPGPITVEAIFRILIRPYTEGDEEQRRLLVYIIQEHRLAQLAVAREIGNKHLDAVALRTIDLLRRVCPHLSEAEIHWRYHLSLGAILSVVSDCAPENRLKNLSGGIANAADRQELIAQVIAFVVSAFRPPTDGPPRQPS